jgi:hypothetical protein
MELWGDPEQIIQILERCRSTCHRPSASFFSDPEGIVMLKQTQLHNDMFNVEDEV